MGSKWHGGDGIESLYNLLMSSREALHNEIDDVPEQMIDEVLDFVHFLKARNLRGREAAILSEAILAQDWLRPEEEQAWSNL